MPSAIRRWTSLRISNSDRHATTPNAEPLKPPDLPISLPVFCLHYLRYHPEKGDVAVSRSLRVRPSLPHWPARELLLGAIPAADRSILPSRGF